MSSQRMKSILETVYETAQGLYEAGLMNRKTFLEFREVCGVTSCFEEADRIREERDQEFLTQFKD